MYVVLCIYKVVCTYNEYSKYSLIDSFQDYVFRAGCFYRGSKYIEILAYGDTSVQRSSEKVYLNKLKPPFVHVYT